MISRRSLPSSSSRIAQRPHVVCVVAAFSADGPVGFHERLLQAGRVPVSASGEADAVAQVVADTADLAEQAGAASDHELVACT